MARARRIAIVAAGMLLAVGATARELKSPDYRGYVREALDRMLARHFRDPARWVERGKLHVVACGAACQVQAWEWTGERKYADGATRFLESIVAAKDATRQACFFTVYPMMYAYRKLDAAKLLDPAFKDRFTGFVGKCFVARDVGDSNQSLCRASGLALAAQAFPDLPRAPGWHGYADKVWDFWYGNRDVTENAPNYNQIDMVYVFLQADALGRTELLRDRNVRAMFGRFRDQVSPAGTIPAYGDSGHGDASDPDWPMENAWGYWPAAFERAGAFYRDPTFRWAATRIFEAGVRHEPLGGYYGHIQPLFHLSFAADWRSAALRPVEPELASAVLTRREPGNPRALDKLVLAPSRSPGSPFVMCDLYVRSHHAHVNQHGGVCYFEFAGVPLLNILGYNNRNPEHTNLLMVREADDMFPHRVPHFSPDRWYEATLPTSRMPRAGGPNERRIGSVTLRVATRGVTFWADGLRLVGPAGEIVLDDFESTAGWSHGPELTDDRRQGESALVWKLGPGVNFVSKRGFDLTFDCTRYTHFKFHWKQSNNSEIARPIIFRVGIDYHAHTVQLEPKLRDARVDSSGRDQYGEMRFDQWFTHDTAHTRRMVLTREGVLVVRDEIVPGKLARGRVAGPVWHLGPTTEPTRGPNWFNSSGAKKELFVLFGRAPGRTFGAQSVDVWSKKGQKTVFAKQPLEAGRPVTFVSVLVPHDPGLRGGEIAKGVRVRALAGGRTVVELDLPAGSVRVAIAGDGKWRVTR